MFTRQTMRAAREAGLLVYFNMYSNFTAILLETIGLPFKGAGNHFDI